ncbi:hypothetical protein M1D93_12365 [Arthrobacter sp. Z1-9]
MSWVGVLPAVVLAAMLLYVPGAVIAACLKFRLGAILGVAPLHSTAAAGLAGVIAGLLGVSWGLLPFLLVSAMLAATALLVTRGCPWRIRRVPWRHVLPFTAIGIATISISWRFVQLVGSPEHPSQVFDNVFHLNAIRFILDTGNASSLTLASLQGVSGLDAVYPAAWHSFAALLVQLTGVDIPAAQNALNLVLAAIVWPASCLFLVSKTISRRPAALIIASVMASTQVAFPFLMIVWGPLFPYAMAISMMPVVITSLAGLARFRRTRTEPVRSWTSSLVLSMAGLAFAHTSAINTTIAVSLPVVALLWWRLGRERAAWRSSDSKSWLFIAGTMAVLVLGAALWFKLRPAPYDNWGPSVKPGAAIGEILTVSTMQSAIPAVVVSVLSVVGLLTVFHMKKLRWVAVGYGIVGALYVVAASFPKGQLRDALVGTWYQDTYRLAALLPLFATPLAVIGGLRLWDSWRGSGYGAQLSHALEGRVPGLKDRGPAATAVAAVAVFTLLATFAGPLTHYIRGASTVYRFDASSDLLTPDELALLERVPNHVPADAVIADNPWNGSSLAYAYTGRRVLTAHLFAADHAETKTIDQRLKESPDSAAVCAALRNQNVQFVLDFGSRYLIDLPGSKTYPGVTDIGNARGFTLVDSQGENAKLYRITACNIT